MKPEELIVGEKYDCRCGSYNPYIYMGKNPIVEKYIFIDCDGGSGDWDKKYIGDFSPYTPPVELVPHYAAICFQEATPFIKGSYRGWLVSEEMFCTDESAKEWCDDFGVKFVRLCSAEERAPIMLPKGGE